MRWTAASLLCLASFTTFAQDAGTLCAQAKQFVLSLDASQKGKALFSTTDDERKNWNFVPLPRKGVPLSDLNETQNEAVKKLLAASLSEQGFSKVNNLPTLEAILREVEGRGENDTYRDPKKYFVSIFGSPECKGEWHWRFEGHHVSLNFSVIDGQIVSSTPSFFGSNPAVVPSGDKKGWELLKDETHLAVKFLQALTPDQQKVAIFSNQALPEIVIGNAKEARLLEPRGIFYKDLTLEQKRAFIRLVDVFVKNYELGFSSRLWDKITKAGIDQLSFAWAGAVEPGKGTYYRIEGPTIVIEYDNTQTNANHVHTAVRDITNDFAMDVLREHYRKEH